MTAAEPVPARYLDPDGRERNRSFDRKADAIAFMNATAAKVDNGTWTDPAAGKITLRKYAEQTYLPALTSEATSIKAIPDSRCGPTCT